MAQAITTIRKVRNVRVGTTHGSSSARAAATAANRYLGLPDVVSDYPFAWSIICARLAGAFDVIREEVQSATLAG